MHKALHAVIALAVAALLLLALSPGKPSTARQPGHELATQDAEPADDPGEELADINRQNPVTSGVTASQAMEEEFQEEQGGKLPEKRLQGKSSQSIAPIEPLGRQVTRPEGGSKPNRSDALAGTVDDATEENTSSDLGAIMRLNQQNAATFSRIDKMLGAQ